MINTYLIKYKKWSAQIAPQYGANMISLEYGDNPILRSPEYPGQLSDNPYTYGNPILMPSNRTYGGSFTFNQKTYCLPINDIISNSHLHGLICRQSFTVVKRDKSFITLVYKNQGEIYPFNFQLMISYSLDEKGAHGIYTLQNIGKISMPLTFGLHTTFIEPETFSVPLLQCQERDSRNIPTGRYHDLNPMEQNFVIGSRSKDLPISGYYSSCGHTARLGKYISYTVSDSFDHWILYNGQGKDGFLCLEPQCGAVNGLNMDKGHRIISPGESLHFKICIEYHVNR